MSRNLPKQSVFEDFSYSSQGRINPVIVRLESSLESSESRVSRISRVPRGLTESGVPAESRVPTESRASGASTCALRRRYVKAFGGQKIEIA